MTRQQKQPSIYLAGRGFHTSQQAPSVRERWSTLAEGSCRFPPCRYLAPAVLRAFSFQRHVRCIHELREYTGHGVGRKMHEGPQVPNIGKAGNGMILRPGLTIALEPMVLVGTYETRVLPDKWTVVSADGSLTAHFEHTVAVTEGDPLILTVL